MDSKKFGTLLMVSMLMASGIVAVLMQGQAEATPTWWNANWDYRRPIPIENSDDNAYTNITVRVNIDNTTGEGVFTYCNIDGSDIRFIASDHSTQLDYWMEYWNYADHDAVFWVKLSSLGASGTTTIYCYYGNSAASSASNGSAVFELFDDFNYDEYRNCSAVGFCGNDNGAIIEKACDSASYTPNASDWQTNQQKMMGITSAWNETEGNVMAYGTYVNASYTAICGMNNTDGIGTDWNEFTNIMVNHSSSDAEPDFLKATEPFFLMNITSTTNERQLNMDYVPDAANVYTMYYSGLNSTNWSINMAYSPVLDAEWTKYPSNPILSNSSGGWDGAGVRSPVVVSDIPGAYIMFYAGTDDIVADTWQIGYAYSLDITTWERPYEFSVFNGTGFGWDNKSVMPLDIHYDGTWLEMIYAGCSWEDEWRIGIAYTNYLGEWSSWSSWSAVIGNGDGSDWDATDVRYATWNLYDNSTERYVLYYTGTNATSKVSMGYGYSMNSSIDGDGGLQNDEGSDRGACYFINNDGQLEVQWNQTMIARELDLANYTVSVDFWPVGTTGHNHTLFMRSSGGWWGNSEDYYGNQLSTDDDAENLVEMANGAATVHDHSDFNYTGTAQHMQEIYAYGDWVYVYSEGFDSNNTQSDRVQDATLSSGEIGIRVDYPSSVKYDYLRAAPSVNTTISAVMGAEASYDGLLAEEDDDTPSGGGGDSDIIQPPATDDGNALSDFVNAIDIIKVMGILVGAYFVYAGAFAKKNPLKSFKLPYISKIRPAWWVAIGALIAAISMGWITI